MTLDLETMMLQGPQISRDQAYRAHANTSHVPDQRAAQEMAWAQDHLRAVAADLLPLAVTPEQQELLASEFARYQAGYVDRKHAQLAAQSRTASAMITGSANFPTRRNQKRMATERRRADELDQWSKRAHAAMRRRLLAARTEDQALDDEWAALKHDIDREMDMVRAIDAEDPRWRGFGRAPFVNSVVGKLRRRANNGEIALVRRALGYIRERQAGMKKPFLTARNGIWRVGEE